MTLTVQHRGDRLVVPFDGELIHPTHSGDTPMTTTPIQHGHDRLVVALDGEITPHSAQEFVVAIDQRLKQYFCRHLEVFVASPGGSSSAALEHMVRAFARWRAAGVDVRAFIIVRAITARAMERARTTARALSEAPRRPRARATDEPPLVRLRTDTRPTFTEIEDVEPRASRHLRRRQRRRPIGALRRPRRRSARRSAPRRSDIVRGRRM